jgi:hypothetical protein
MKKASETTKKRDRERLAKALMEILTNPETSDELEDKLTDWINDACSGSIVGRFTQVPGGLQALEHLLAFAEWQKAHENWPGEIREVSYA